MIRAFNTRIIFRTMGALLLIEAVFMAMALMVSWWNHDYDEGSFLVSTVLTAIAGFIGLAIGHDAPRQVGEREGYVIVAMVWLVFSVFGMLPYYLSGQIPTITDAWFETMSGFTTTGATIVTNIEQMTHGFLFWRSLTQWLGGMGIIVLSIAILPMFGLGGMQLYAAEVTGLQYEKLSPRIADTAKHLWITYILLTLAEAVLLYTEGMTLFDALCHSFTTVATGGFSTKNLGIAYYYDNPAIAYTIGVFIVLSSINFAMIILLFRGKAQRLLHDEETHWFLGAVVFVTLILTIGLTVQRALRLPDPNVIAVLKCVEPSLREGFFTTVATMTSTGYSYADYMQWAPFLWVVVFFLMFTGGSSGSTAGGVKWIRIAIFAKSGLAEFQRRIHPNAIVPVKINHQPITQQTTNNVMAFMLFYVIILAVSTLVFCALGVDFDESIGTSVSCMGNIGPAIGQYGPAGTFAAFPTAGKWIMTFVMLIGRLEIFTVLLLFTRALWRK